jgi:SAM-dependent methyltransferase
MSLAIWHDVECGSYDEDLALWRALAEREAGPVLDVGAGTGRVALHLARRGHEVVGLDLEQELLDVLRDRAGDLPVRTVRADARGFDLGAQRFGLILAPMQTVQLLGAAGRAGFLRSVAAHLRPGGLAACALADALEAFDAEHTEPPLPDIQEHEGIVYSSQPVALRVEGERVAIERIRQVVDRAGRRTAEGDVIHLDRLDAATLASEGAAAGLRPEPAAAIGATADHVGSTVVMLRG